MIADLKPYPTMKDSGVEWLGEVPEHWKVNAWRAVASAKKGRQPKALISAGSQSECDLPYLSMKFLRSPSWDASEFAKQQPDLLIASSGDTILLWDGANAGEFFIAKPGVVSSTSALVKPKRLSEDYFFYSCKLIEPTLRAFTNGMGIPHVDGDVLKTLSIACPPHPEQAAIARFLDHVDRRIHRYLRAKQKLIGLLEEQKQVIIHRAVTRGLDPDVPLKPSGNRWFPEVPEHWDVLPMGRLIHCAVDGPHYSPSYLDEGIPFLSARNIKVDRWSLGDAKYISDADYTEFCKRVKPEQGDVLYTKGGTTGVARAVDLDFLFQVWVHIAVLKLNKDKVRPTFLAAALNTPRCYEQSQLFTRGATNQDLGLGRMKDIMLPVPPVIEQDAIAAFVGSTSNGLLRAIKRAEHEIELLREYRTRLIADVVTGKLDVREAAAKLPEVPDEPEGHGVRE